MNGLGACVGRSINVATEISVGMGSTLGPLNVKNLKDNMQQEFPYKLFFQISF